MIKMNKPDRPFNDWKVFPNAEINISSGDNDHVTVFGSNTFDISGITSSNKPVSVVTVFGETHLFLSRDVTYELEVTTVFGGTNFHNDIGRGGGLGTKGRIIGAPDNPNRVKLEIVTVFGSITVSFRNTPEVIISDE